MVRRAGFGVLGAHLSVLGAVACRAKPPPEAQEAPVVEASAPAVVPPAAPFNATPVAAELEAGAPSDQLAQARAYEASGQLWMARLLLEPRALAPDGTKEEVELLARVCRSQGDGACLERCAQRLGGPLASPAGSRAGAASKEPPLKRAADR